MKSYNYEDFVEKFKPKRTTDDCYTPEEVYNAVCQFVESEYSLNKTDFIRPFYPGGDYINYPYKKNNIVVDNPPFSILSKIINFYIENNIKFFLFAPTLTVLNLPKSTKKAGLPLPACIIIKEQIIYDNGAQVKTSFITNLEPEGTAVRICPKLNKAIKDSKKKEAKTVYDFPPTLTNGARLSTLCGDIGEDLRLDWNECEPVANLDAGLKVFGGGVLMSEEAGQRLKEYKETTKMIYQDKVVKIWELSERERAIIDRLNRKEG